MYLSKYIVIIAHLLAIAYSQNNGTLFIKHSLNHSNGALIVMQRIKNYTSKIECAAYCQGFGCHGFHPGTNACVLYQIKSLTLAKMRGLGDLMKQVYVKDGETYESDPADCTMEVLESSTFYDPLAIVDDVGDCQDSVHQWWGTSKTNDEYFIFKMSNCVRVLNKVTLINHYYSQWYIWGTKDYTIEYSLDDPSLTQGWNWNLIHAGTMPDMTDQFEKTACELPPEVITVDPPVVMTFFKFTANTHYGTGGAGLQYLGLE